MAEGSRIDDVERLLSEQKSLEDRKQALIADLLRQKEAGMQDFDEKLMKLGYRIIRSAKPKRSHHKKAAQPGPEGDAIKAKTKV